ncbi:MAG: ABC transporter substrate-binding protein [Firmicutes bacterium]|nr:ABC transporter substrate-binding protein [Bacillota bacterium]
MTKAQKVIILISTLILVFSTAAFAASAITIEIWRPAGAAVPAERAGRWWDDDGEILKKFQETHPNIKVKIEDIPFEQFDNKELTALRAGIAPDVVFVNHVTVGAAVGTGGLEQLDDFIAKSKVIKSEDFIPGLWKIGNIRGKQYTIPWDTDTRILWYNKKILKDVGVAQPPRTWDEWLNVLNKIKTLNKRNIFGYGFFGASYWGVLYQDVGPYLVMKDTSFLTPDGANSAALSPKTIDAFEFAVKLAKFAPEAAVTYTDSDLDNIFAQGKQAFYVWGMWYKDTLRGLRPDWKLDVDYGISLLPGPEPGKTGSSNGGWHLAIPKAAKHKKEAWAFLEFLYQPDIMALGTRFHIPTRISVMDYPYFKGDPFVELSLQQAKFGRPPVPCVAQLPEIAQIVQRQYLRAVRGEITSEAALKEIDRRIIDALKK